MWPEGFQFDKDPYEKLNPYLIDFQRLVWDRPDLPKAKKDMDKFVCEVFEGKRIAIKLYGPSGCGKTWFTRIIQKELSEKLLKAGKNMVFMYTKIPRYEGSLQIAYKIGIEYFLENYFENLVKCVKNPQVEDWERLVNDHDLAMCFHKLLSGTPMQKIVAREWLSGEKLSASDLSVLEISYSLDTDYERIEMLRKLIEELSNVFSNFVLVIDELENAQTKLAGQISDALRDLLDSFSDKFALVASFTAQKLDEWYDLGYTEQLDRRFDYSVELASLSLETISEFLRIHQRAYRKKGAKIEDELFPFTEEGVAKLLTMTPPEFHYPGYFLPNCKEIVRAAEGKTKKIDSAFVEKNFPLVRFK
jgi:hypothetical protein